MRYGIGLDIGIESVGYAILELDYSDMPRRITDFGVRIFDKAEHPKDGSSLAVPRREARGMRRRLRRHRHRLERIRGLIVSAEILTADQLDHLYEGNLSDIYGVRVKALDELVTPEEFARILIHLAQRRGFKSNRKADSQSKEGGALLSAIGANKTLLEEKGYRSIGEMMLLDEKFKEYKRNKGESYAFTVERDGIESEARLIFDSQRKFGAQFADETIENKYLEILLSQRSFADGPACGPYSGNQTEKMIGKCTFLTEEPRAAKATYSFQAFNLWQHINHIRININGSAIPLSESERWTIFELAHNKKDLSFAQIRKALKLHESANFVGINCKPDERDAFEKKKKLNDLAFYHKVKACLDKADKTFFPSLSSNDLDIIGEALSKNYSDDKIVEILSQNGIATSIAEELLTLPNEKKYGHLCLKVLKDIIPHLEQGLTYDKACEAAGYNFKADEIEPKFTLDPLPNDNNEITSPVARRAISQTIKVINAIIRKMGESPVYLNIELARELSRSYDDRKKIQKSQDENAKRNESALQQLKEYATVAPGGQDIVKFKLWQEQDGICPYSGEHIDIARITEPGYVDVDHIVPYSRCFDDRMINKVLVLSRENRQKGNRLPLEYLSGEKRDRFIVWVNNHSFSYTKKSRLLKESIDNENDWKQRNLQDTQFISAFMHRYIKDNLKFAPFMTQKVKHVTAVNGAITAYVRKRWGIQKMRENGDLHHAVDAVVIGCITQGMINKISKHSYYKETYENGDYKLDEETGELISRFPAPWPHFRDELEIRLNPDAKKLRKQLFDVNYESYAEIDLDSIDPIFVSRMSNHKVTGAAHQETVRSAKKIEQGKVISKVPLSKLKLKDGEIDGYYNPDSDVLLYNALKERLQAFGGDGAKAFPEGYKFYKPRANGEQGPEVKKVKVEETTSLSVAVQQNTGIANNETMVRCDVFYIEGDGYYFVPIYVADTVKSELPKSAPTQTRDKITGQKIWKPMDERDFVFSLYPNDLFKIYSEKAIKLNVINEKSSLDKEKIFAGEKGVFLYFKGLDISTAFISGITHDNTYKHRSIGKTTMKIEKYEVDVLGNVRKVEKEQRQRFHIKHN